jgi:hypothetical protein
MAAKDDFSLRILLFRVHSVWVVQGVDYAVKVSAPTIPEAKKEVGLSISAGLARRHAIFGRPIARVDRNCLINLFGPAPKFYIAQWESLLESADQNVFIEEDDRILAYGIVAANSPIATVREIPISAKTIVDCRGAFLD